MEAWRHVLESVAVYWFDILPRVAMAVLIVGAVAISIVGWVQNRRQERQARAERDERHSRFLWLLALVRRRL